MATRRSFLTVLGMGLFSASAAWANSPGGVPPSVSTSDSVDTVRHYLAYRATNEWTKAYALLSMGTQRELPLDEFGRLQPFPSGSSADRMPPIAVAIISLFANTDGTEEYKYQVVGIAPEDPHTVLVSAQPPQAGLGKASPPLLLRLVTAPDPQTGASRIEMEPSLLKTDPTVFEKAREKARQTTSLSNLKQIGLAMIQYTQDHDERYPAADKWIDAITPYLVGIQGSQAQREQTLASLFHDPTSPDNQKWSYAFNSNLSGLTQAQMDSVAKTVLLFESNAGVKNAADTGQSVPRPGRHTGGTDYAFADGHVKWISDTLTDTQRNEILSFSPSAN